MADRLAEVLEEAVQVRAEMGWPLMATPFSQLVGIQALLNVVQGERYATIPDENLMYIAGWYGDPPGTVDDELKDRALAMQRGRQIMDSEPEQPSLEEIRAAYGEKLSDEELILRYLMPGTDVDAMQQAQTPIEPVHPIGDLGWIADTLKTGASRYVRVTRGDVSIELRR
jgi:oxaloacetate decarboxylase alpha subunit